MYYWLSSLQIIDIRIFTVYLIKLICAQILPRFTIRIFTVHLIKLIQICLGLRSEFLQCIRQNHADTDLPRFTTRIFTGHLIELTQILSLFMIRIFTVHLTELTDIDSAYDQNLNRTFDKFRGIQILPGFTIRIFTVHLINSDVYRFCLGLRSGSLLYI